MLISKQKNMTESEKIAVDNSNNQYLQALSYVAVGTIYPYAGQTPPETFMFCDGTELDIDEYAELFGVIGYEFGGSGDKFNLPTKNMLPTSSLNYIIKTMQDDISGKIVLQKGTEVVFLGGDAKSSVQVEHAIDDKLSLGSENPVKNLVIAKELQKYTPTEQADKMYVSAEDYASDKATADNERSGIKKNLENIVDYVEEQGTSGIWIYEKWNSGKIECYGEYYHSILGMTADGAVYGENIEIPLPNGLFNTKPTFACGNVDISGSVNIRVWQSTNTKLAVRIISTQQYGVGNACTLLLYAVGKWK